MTYTLSPSWKATQRPLGEGTISSAKGRVRWTRSSLPSRRTETRSVTTSSSPFPVASRSRGKKSRSSGPNEGRMSCRRAPLDRLAPKGRPTTVTGSAAPPDAGTRTSSQKALCVMVRPRAVAPAPRTTTICSPSGLQTGWMKSPASAVSRSGFPPEARTFQRCPRPISSQEVKAIHRPSGDHAGAYSSGSNPSGVRRRGVPFGRSMVQIRPTA